MTRKRVSSPRVSKGEREACAPSLTVLLTRLPRLKLAEATALAYQRLEALESPG